MRKYKKIKIEKKIIKKVFCDLCKKKIDMEDLGNRDSLREGGSIIIHFDYPSKNECETYEGDICDDCFDKIFKNKLKMTYDGFYGSIEYLDEELKRDWEEE